MTTDEARPARSGYRWPAEWEEHVATWLTWPHARTTWPGEGRLERVERAYVAMVEALSGRERVRIVVDGAAREERARGALRAAGVDADRGIEFVAAPTDDSWIRDCGPIFLCACDAAPAGARPARLALDFGFNAWGGKYPPFDRDDALARRVARAAGVECATIDAVLEGGSVDGNGAGTVLTTEACLLHANRGPVRGGPRTRESVEALLGDCLGAERVLWLGDGIVGDDTDGHVDDIARFVGPHTVVATVEPDASDPNHAPLAENLRRLASMRTADDKPIDVVELPMPAPLRLDGERLPASHANFLLANGVALVPVFGGASDARALAVLRECLPGRDVVGIPANDLVVGLGAVHCLSQQEPR